jgi:hypothetical protein
VLGLRGYVTCRLFTLTRIYLKENCFVGIKLIIREQIAGATMHMLHRLMGTMIGKTEEMCVKTSLLQRNKN